MVISDYYDIEDIVIDIEAALRIDGKDYAEREYYRILDNVRNRIISSYGVDLSNCKITDPSLYMGVSRNKTVLFLENIANLHSKISGYLQIVRYQREVTIKPINVNYLGFDEKKLISVLKLCTAKQYIPSIEQNLESIKSQIGTINACLEKKLFLIMLIAHDLGFDELFSAIAEILYTGGKV